MRIESGSLMFDETAPRASRTRSHEILDTPSTSQLDEIISLTANALEVPAAMISLLEGDSLSSVGPARELPFCAHTLAGRAMFVVPDALADERFEQSALVRAEPAVRFYAGMPLETCDGVLIGTLYVIDHQPRELTPRHRTMLRQFANQVISLLELRRVGHELRKGQQRIAEREQELSSLLDSMGEGVVKQDRTGAIILSNRAAEEILGLRGERLAGRTSTDSQWSAIRSDGSPFPGEEHPAMIALSRGVASRDVEMGLIRAETGERKWIAISSRPLDKPGDDQPYAALTTFRDITETRGVRERLARHERLVATGTLAAGVGHEINNPLAFMMANLALAIEEVEAIGKGGSIDRLPEVTGLLEQAQKGGERVKRIVRGLRSMARPEDERGPLDPHTPIKNALELAAHEVRTRAAISMVLDRVPPILGDEGRLTQVIVNLVVNAAQAFETADPTTNSISVRTHHEHDHVVIEVIDNGPGIPPDVLPRIFDPFFTTKPPGVGTGLGLSISHGIVAAMGGRLDCVTTLGRGTTFRVSFPSMRESVETPAATTGRALVIDDERTILTSLARILRRELDQVELVEDSREALALFERGERFDLVLCDIWMPHLTGIELFEAVRRIAPAQLDRFVFLSGDMTRPEIRQFLSNITNERIDKPFGIDAIRNLARRFIRR